MYKTALISGSLFAGLAVILGAFGAHALKEIMPAEQLQTFEVGVRYQLYHAFALLFVGLAYAHYPVKSLQVAAWLFIIGVFLFSGSLYLLSYLKMNAVVGLTGIGILTPIGGMFFIAGWCSMVYSFFTMPKALS